MSRCSPTSLDLGHSADFTFLPSGLKPTGFAPRNGNMRTLTTRRRRNPTKMTKMIGCPDTRSTQSWARPNPRSRPWSTPWETTDGSWPHETMTHRNTWAILLTSTSCKRPSHSQWNLSIPRQDLFGMARLHRTRGALTRGIECRRTSPVTTQVAHTTPNTKGAPRKIQRLLFQPRQAR